MKTTHFIHPLWYLFIFGFGVLSGLQAQNRVKPVPALLTNNADNTQIREVFVVASAEGGRAVRLARNQNDQAGEEQSLANATLTFVEPAEYVKGMEAMGRANYAEAAQLFQDCTINHLAAQYVPLNYSMAARFRYGQCMIFTGNWDSFRRSAAFTTRPELLPKGMQEQAQLFTLWLNYGEESWVALQNSLETIDPSTMSSAARAEFEFLRGRSLENDNKLDEAMEAYHSSIALSRFSSPALTKLAANRLLRLYLADEKTKKGLELDSQNLLVETSQENIRLKSAALVYHLYSGLLTQGETAPAGSEVFAPYLTMQIDSDEAE